MFKENGLDAVILDHVIDSHFISFLELSLIHILSTYSPTQARSPIWPPISHFFSPVTLFWV